MCGSPIHGREGAGASSQASKRLLARDAPRSQLAATVEAGAAVCGERAEHPVASLEVAHCRACRLQKEGQGWWVLAYTCTGTVAASPNQTVSQAQAGRSGGGRAAVARGGGGGYTDGGWTCSGGRSGMLPAPLTPSQVPKTAIPPHVVLSSGRTPGFKPSALARQESWGRAQHTQALQNVAFRCSAAISTSGPPAQRPLSPGHI